MNNDNQVYYGNIPRIKSTSYNCFIKPVPFQYTKYYLSIWPAKVCETKN